MRTSRWGNDLVSTARSIPSYACSASHASDSARVHSSCSYGRSPCGSLPSCLRAASTAVCTMPSTTAVNSEPTNGAAASDSARQFPGHAKRVAGNFSNDMPWLCVATMPWPSHSATSLIPFEPSHGTPRTSRKNQSGSVSPSGRPVVSMKDVTPDPDPKCFCPVNR